MIEKEKVPQAIGNYVQTTKNWFEKSSEKVAVTRGCPNKICNCTGDCLKVIGFRDRLPGEF